jgi:uncharacterized protein YjiS (DUF1127 family)
MSTHDTTRTHFHTVLLADRIGQALAAVYDSIKSWNEERQTRAILSNLSDSELADIGLNRYDIDAVARAR